MQTGLSRGFSKGLDAAMKKIPPAIKGDRRDSLFLGQTSHGLTQAGRSFDIAAICLFLSDRFVQGGKPQQNLSIYIINDLDIKIFQTPVHAQTRTGGGPDNFTPDTPMAAITLNFFFLIDRQHGLT